MKAYDTLLIGSGYAAIGYAEARQNCLVVEERQIADTQFYLPMRGFAAGEMTANTQGGERLLACMRGMGLIKDGALCVNGLECAFARYLLDTNAPLLLKCRAVRAVAVEGGYEVTLQTNAGLSTVRAKKIIDTRPTGRQRVCVLLLVKGEADSTLAAVLAAFPGATVSPAFYEGRYALTIPADGYDENSVKCMIEERFPRGLLDVQILYIAPAFIYEGVSAPLSDASYPDPITAYEAGYRAGEVTA